jgi:hypothetical protein
MAVATEEWAASVPEFLYGPEVLYDPEVVYDPVTVKRLPEPEPTEPVVTALCVESDVDVLSTLEPDEAEQPHPTLEALLEFTRQVVQLALFVNVVVAVLAMMAFGPLGLLFVLPIPGLYVFFVALGACERQIGGTIY